MSTVLMDDADTMAERDLGSTFLLPHTHLYKSDRVRSSDWNKTKNRKNVLNENNNKLFDFIWFAGEWHIWIRFIVTVITISNQMV